MNRFLSRELNLPRPGAGRYGCTSSRRTEPALGHLHEIIRAVSIQPSIRTIWTYGSGCPEVVADRAESIRAIGSPPQTIGSGKGRRAVSVMRGLHPGVSGCRRAGHGADELVVREGGRWLLKHRGGRGGEQATLAVVRVSGVVLQPVAVVRWTDEQYCERDGAGKREEFHGARHQVA